MPAGQLAIIKHRPPPLVPAEPSLAMLLGADKYEKATGLLARGRRPVAGATEDDECYAGLGIARDFSSDLVMYAFRKQAVWIPEQSAFFYDGVLEVSQKRLSEDMNVNVATLASQGYFTRDEVKEAYRYLGFNDQAKNWSTLSVLSDNDILGQFDSRRQNTAKSQESELRHKLRIIAKSRASAMLQSVSENGEESCFIQSPPMSSLSSPPTSPEPPCFSKCFTPRAQGWSLAGGGVQSRPSLQMAVPDPETASLQRSREFRRG
jgi:hypothetical protein